MKEFLGEICRFEYGKSLPDKDRAPGTVLVFGSNGVIGNHSQSYTLGETIVIGRKGSIGEIILVSDSCWPIDTTYYIDRTCTDCDLAWLSFVLKSLKLGGLNKGTGVPGLNREDAYKQRIELPSSIEEQRRIAEKLNAKLAEVETARKALELQQQEVVNLANAIIRESIEQSPVIETRVGLVSAKTVGAGHARDLNDLSHTGTYSRAWPAPTDNPISVTETRLGEVLEEIKQGIGATWADYPVLGATRGGLAPAKEPPGKYPQRYKPVFCGTVFYNPMRIMIGSIAFVDDDDEPGITSPDYVALRGKAGQVDSRWFYYWLRSPYGEHCINSLARGAVRERMLFNRLAEGSILLPPYPEQLRASKALATLKPIKSAIQKQLNELNKIPERLLAQAFEKK